MAKFFNPHAQIDLGKHHLPHWAQESTWTFVTFRLADSLPQEKLKQFKAEEKHWQFRHPKPWTPELEGKYHRLFSKRIEDWMDQGMGSCLLQEPKNAQIVANALLHFHQERYFIASFVIMPNHVHVLFCPNSEFKLGKIIHSWKSFSAQKINQQNQRTGKIWQNEYWDRLIRNEAHFAKVNNYIQENPSKANLNKDQFILRSFLPPKERGLPARET